MRRPYISIFHHHNGISVAVLTEDAVDYWQRTEGHDPTNEYELLEEVELPQPYAAAPELLKALRAAVTILSGWEATSRADAGDTETVRLCKQALAKAEGRSE